MAYKKGKYYKDIIDNDLRPKIHELETENKKNSEDHNTKTQELIDKHESEIKQLKKTINDQKDINKKLTDDLNLKELKKLAQAYRDQEIEFKDDQDKWLKWVTSAFVLVGFSAAFTLFASNDDSLSNKLDNYVINFILITFLIFTLRQYSTYKFLRIDYSNRKTIAQSYHNIVDSADVDEQDEIKKLILEKSVDILTAKSNVKDESHTIVEKIFENRKNIKPDSSE